MMCAARASIPFSHSIVRVARAIASIALFVSTTTALCGTPQIPPLSLMNHKTWTARDGAPQGVRALAQASDGTLWIGTEGGLFNFDGRAFHPFQPPPGEPNLAAGPIASLRVTRDGALWAGSVQGVARISAGHVTLHPDADEKLLGSITFLAEAADGSLWGSGRAMLCRIGPDGIAHLEQAPLPLGSSPVGGIFIDSSNTLWIGQAGKLYRRSLDQADYVPTDIAVDYIFGFSEVADGNLWITDVDTKRNLGRYQRIDRSGALVGSVHDDTMAFSILPAADGSLIVGSQMFGLRNFRDDQMTRAGQMPVVPTPETYTRVDGLSADEIRALLRDTDGSVWAGGRRGLDRFRPAQLTPFVAESGRLGATGWAVCANGLSDVWVMNVAALYRRSQGSTQALLGRRGSYIECGKDGDARWIDADGIWQAHGEQIVNLPHIPGVIPYGYRQVVSGPQDALYALAYLPPAAAGLWKYDGATWAKLPATGVPGQPPISEYIDSQQRLWLGHRKGLIGLPLEQRLFSSGDPGLDNVYALRESSHGMFAAGANGLAVWRGASFEVLSFADASVVRGVGGIVESLDGDLWLNASRGIVHLRREELEAGLKDIHYPIKTELVNEGEFVGPVDLVSRATAARDEEGNLWFATLNGVFHFNPAHLVPDTHPPIVSIRSLTVDGKPLAEGEPIAPRPQTLVIQYLGVDLTTPERVTYRYRLEGLEDTWQDAGRRTEAIYTQLPPGSYTFQVMASNRDGAWTAPVSAPVFRIAPAFNQTLWFRLLLVCAGIVVLYGVFVLRLRGVTRGIRVREQARADERVRIARDLHDTLLQGIQGLLLSVHVAANHTPDSTSKAMLQRALSSADDIMIEGRDRLSSLRAERITDAELLSAIENVARDLAAGHSTQYRVTRSGAGETLQTHVGDEIFSIAREALTNAFRYAQATEIHIAIDYGRQFFRLACADDGRGFASEAENVPGHFGLRGMSERAKRLGGRFQCHSEPGKGTKISVIVPSFRAYRRSSRWRHYLGRVFTPKPA